MKFSFYGIALIATLLFTGLSSAAEQKRRPPPPPPPPPGATTECDLPSSILSTTRKKSFSIGNFASQPLPTFGAQNLGPITLPTFTAAEGMVQGEAYRLSARKLWQHAVYLDTSKARVFPQYNFISLGKEGHSILLRVPKPNKNYLIKIGMSSFARRETNYSLE